MHHNNGKSAVCSASWGLEKVGWQCSCLAHLGTGRQLEWCHSGLHLCWHRSLRQQLALRLGEMLPTPSRLWHLTLLQASSLFCTIATLLKQASVAAVAAAAAYDT